MGTTLFSAGVSFQKLFNNVPATGKGEAMLRSVVHDGDITTELLERQISGLRSGMNKAFVTMDKHPDLTVPYVWSFAGTKGSISEVEDIIAAEVGEPVTVESMEVQSTIIDFIGRWYLQENHGYTESSGIVANYPTAIDPKWEATYVRTLAGDATPTYFEIIVTLSLRDTTEVDPTYTEEHVFDLTTIGPNSRMYHVKYHTDALPNETVLWVYDPEVNDTYPELEIEPTSEQPGVPIWWPPSEEFTRNWENGNEPRDFLPFIPFKENALYPAEGSDKRKTLQRVSELIKIDYESLFEGVAGHPTPNEVYSVHLGFMMNPLEDNGAAADEYWWYHFKSLRQYQTRDRIGFEQAYAFNIFETSPKPTSNSVRIADGIQKFGNTTVYTDQSMNISTNWVFVDEKIKQGTFEKARESSVSTLYQADPDGPYAGQSIHKTALNHLYVRKQLTRDTYSELYIVNPETIQMVSTPFGTKQFYGTGIGPYYNNQYSTDIFMPLKFDALNQINSAINADEILQKAAVMQFHGISIQQLEWYEESLFTFLVQSLAIMVALVTMQPQIALIAAAPTILAGALIAVGIIVDLVLFSIIVDYAVRFLIDEFGLEGVFTAIVVALVTAVIAKGSNALLDFSVTWADQLLKLTLSTLDTFTEVTQEYQVENETETSAFLQSSEERQEEIDEANDLLSSDIQYLELTTRKVINVNETPTQFFDRTIHAGNVGVQSLDVIENYVGNALRLPETDLILV